MRKYSESFSSLKNMELFSSIFRSIGWIIFTFDKHDILEKNNILVHEDTYLT